MKKKILTSLLGVGLILTSFLGIQGVLSQAKIQRQDSIIIETVGDVPSKDQGVKAPFNVEAKSAILVDAKSGRTLFEQEAHKELPFASVTKVMTMLLVMEAIEDGKISLEDKVQISAYAASMGGSQMYMEAGEIHTVEELLKGVAMASANDGCVALAEHVAGSEEIFVERMNERAKELGMRDTHFVNTNGLPVADHYSSAYDIALMSKALYAYEKTHEWFTTWQSTVTVGLPGKETQLGLTNTNKLIKQYQGCNGIKTGFTSDAGYCLSASAIRNDTHLIAVALGCESSKIRNAQICKLFDYGFANYETVSPVNEGDFVTKVIVEKAEPLETDLVALNRAFALLEKGKEKNLEEKIVLKDEIKLPAKKGQEIGQVEYYSEGKLVCTCPIGLNEDIEKASFIELLKRRIYILMRRDVNEQ